MVRYCLLLFVVLQPNFTLALSSRSASKVGILRHRLHSLASRPRVPTWVKAAVYGSALLTLASAPHAEESDLLVQPTRPAVVQAEDMDRNIFAGQVHTLSWQIAVTTKGKLAHMHVQAIEDGGMFRITGYIEPTAKGGKYFDPASSSYHRYVADRSYALQDQPYDGFTLPLRLSWLAAVRSQRLSQINEILPKIVASEQALVELGDSMYRGFSRLHVAASDDYRFENLAAQVEVKFAGRRFFDRQAVSGAIERRHVMLQTRRIAHQPRRPAARFNADILQQAVDTYHAALALLPVSASAPTALNLNFDSQAQDDASFVALVESLADFKQLRLLLAEDILSLYEPFRMPFFYVAQKNTRERLVLLVFAEDSKRRGVAFRYKILTTAAKHKRVFTLAQVDFDHNANIKKMWVSLKPRGGLARFGKMTFTPCVAGACPEPNFARD